MLLVHEDRCWQVAQQHIATDLRTMPSVDATSWSVFAFAKLAQGAISINLVVWQVVGLKSIRYRENGGESSLGGHLLGCN